MNDVEQMWDNMDRYRESSRKNVSSKKTGNRLFPVLIVSMLVLPVVMVMVDQGALWYLLVIPAVLVVSILWFYARNKHWSKQEKFLHEKIKTDIAESFHLDLSGQEGRGDAGASIKKGGV